MPAQPATTSALRPLTSQPRAQARVERVAQAVAEDVHAPHGQRQEQSREEDVVREDPEQGMPSAMMLPQVGVSGGKPTPRKDRIASTRIAEAQMNVPCTISGAPSLLTARPHSRGPNDTPRTSCQSSGSSLSALIRYTALAVNEVPSSAARPAVIARRRAWG